METESRAKYIFTFVRQLTVVHYVLLYSVASQSKLQNLNDRKKKDPAGWPSRLVLFRDQHYYLYQRDSSLLPTLPGQMCTAQVCFRESKKSEK